MKSHIVKNEPTVKSDDADTCLLTWEAVLNTLVSQKNKNKNKNKNKKTNNVLRAFYTCKISLSV